MRRVGAALVAGLLALALAVALVLASSPVTVAGTNPVAAHELAVYMHYPARDCQPSGTIPRGTNAIRLSLGANVGPAVAVSVLVGGRTVAHGARRGGWGEDETVTVGIGTLSHTVRGALVCTTIAQPIESLQINGTPVPPGTASAGDIAGVYLHLEYLRAAPGSWLSRLGAVVRRLGFGHALGGVWIALLALVLMMGVLALAVRLILVEL